MRQFLAIACVVGLFMYAGFSVQYGTGQPAAAPVKAAQVDAKELRALARALEATGARLEETLVAGRVEVARSSDRDRVLSALGWTSKSPQGEFRQAEVQGRDGKYLLIVRWSVQGKSAAEWEARLGAVQKALTMVGTAAPLVTVQLGGTAATGLELPQVAARALDAVQATDRQPWTGGRSASLAGRSAILPQSPLGVNIQVAARRDTGSHQTRVWVAWPALLLEY